MANVLFKAGTRAQYDALLTKDPNTLYWLSDTLELLKGEDPYGVGAAATASAAGLLSAADKAKLDELAEGSVLSLTAADASIIVGGSGSDLTIGVAVSSENGNAIQLNSDGLFVSNTENATYIIERQSSPTDGYSTSYRLKKTADGVSTYVGDSIDIPRDLVLESGSLEVVTVTGEPYEDAIVGDIYIELVLNDAEASHIYIPVSDLVDTYEPGNGIDITDNEISVEVDASNANGLSVNINGLGLDLATTSAAGALSPTDKLYLDELPSLLANKTDRRLTCTNGVSVVSNGDSGGGMKFEHTDGTWSFIGVNDGGEDGITGQIYSVSAENGQYVGSRLNITTGGFYYLPNSGSSSYTAGDEIATKGDVAAATAAALAWEDL